MNRIGIILLGAFVCGVVLTSSGALAHTSHANDHVLSPFDAPKAKKSLHCMLKKHSHRALPFCPHTMRVRTGHTELKTDCGDSSSGTQVQTSWSKTFLFLKPIAKLSHNNREITFTSVQLILSSFILDPLEKPPQ